MKAKWIPIMRETKRLSLGFDNTISHYSVAILPLVVPACIFYYILKDHIIHSQTGKNMDEDISFAFIFIVLSIIFFFIQRRALNFKEFEIVHTENDFTEAVKRTAKELEAHIENCNNQFARINRPWNWENNLGERITIISNNHTILFNSITNPWNAAITSWGWNKKNENIFIKNLHDVVNHIPEKEPQEEIFKNEWSLKKIAVRLFLYPLSLSIIALCIWGLTQDMNIIRALLGIAICCTYLYSDLKIILRRNKD